MVNEGEAWGLGVRAQVRDLGAQADSTAPVLNTKPEYLS